MSTCENCQAEILSDAQFCEVCGHKVGDPKPEKATKKTGTEPLATTPGSLRGEIPFLAGAVDQAKVRLDQWKQKGDQAKQEAVREADLKRQEKEAQKKERSGRRGAGIVNFLVGLLALMVFVYLLVRLPRKGNPTHLLQLWQEMIG